MGRQGSGDVTHLAERAILELAAKAAGFKIEENCLAPKGRNVVWSPFSDDGDPLCLAVALGLDQYFLSMTVSARSATNPRIDGTAYYGGNRARTTRRAIVSAAAEISRSALVAESIASA